MRERFIFANGQSFNDEDVTGTISQNIWDLEYDDSAVLIRTDAMIQGYLNGIITSYSYTSGGGEGLEVGLRMDDEITLDTTRSGAAGYVDVCIKNLQLQHLVAGLAFSVPFICDLAKRYLGAWVRAGRTPDGANSFVSTTLAMDLWFENTPISKKRLQKKPATL